MNRETVLSEIQDIARKVFEKPELMINDSLCATDVDSWTSLTFMQLIDAIEKKYGFNFKMMELLKLQNMGAIIDTTVSHLEK